MSLLKLMLVDDEAIILKGLLKTYEWESMGFEVVGTASDGDIAISLIEKLKPDVILTDICMKRMSGLELMEKVKENHQDICFVVVSAYKDFEYAQKACQNGAFSYLLKPIDDLELEKTMSKVYEEYHQKLVKEQKYENWKKLLIEDKDSFLHLMVGRYLNSGINEEELLHLFEGLSVDPKLNHYYAAVCADIDLSYKVISQSDYEAKRYILITTLEKKFKEQYIVNTYLNADGSQVYIVDLQDKVVVTQLKKMVSNVKNELNYKIISSISNGYKGISGMKLAYRQALKVYEVALEAGASILTMPKEVDVTLNHQYSVDIESQMLGAIRKNDEVQLKESFTKFIFALPNKEEVAKIYFHRLAVRIEFALQDSYGLNENTAESFKNFYIMLNEHQLVRLVDIFYQLMCEVIKERKESFSSSSEQFFEDYIIVALEYIHNHIQDENLSISSVAEQIYLNPVYFGRVFKSVVKVPFKTYVLNERIERAKALILEDNDSIAGICEKVGIPNPSYFTQLFKKSTGKLPSEYKRNDKNEEA